jgi:hypothetical protein
MTNTHRAPARPAKQFCLQPGNNGCDETFDIVCVATGRVIASLPFWDERAATLRDARIVMSALERFHRRGGHAYARALLQTLRRLDPYRNAFSDSRGGDDAAA